MALPFVRAEFLALAETDATGQPYVSRSAVPPGRRTLSRWRC